MKLHLTASRLHKWLALIIGAQLLIWFTSGVIMSFLPIGEVRGEHLVNRDAAVQSLADSTILPPQQFASRVPGATSVTLRMRAGQPTYAVQQSDNIRLFDAVTGTPAAPLTAGQAIIIAKSGWIGTVKPATSASRVTRASTEYRGPLPAWRVRFADSENTSVFIPLDTAQIAAVRTGSWRLYDFFWGLHIMDWKNHEDFNSWWLLGFAIGGLVLGLAGTMLLAMRWPIRRRRL